MQLITKICYQKDTKRQGAKYWIPNRRKTDVVDYKAILEEVKRLNNIIEPIRQRWSR